MSRAAQPAWPGRRLEITVLLGILLLAAYLRLSAPGVVEFKRDEANLSQLALDLARGRSFPLLGISSSVGVPNPPISVYIFSVPYLLTSNPIFATQFVGVLNVLAVFLTYLLARRYYGASAALLAALLYAVSPWGIIYSRKIWAQDLLPPFVLATLLAGLIGFVEGKRWAQWLCLPLLSITAQIHYSALLLVVPVVYLVWIGRPRWTRAFFLSFFPAFLLLIPFILGVLGADLPTLDELRSLNASSGDVRALGLTDLMLRYAALTIGGTEIHSLAGPQAFEEYLASVPDAYPLFGLLAWAVLFAVFWLSIRAWKMRDSRRQVDALLLIWLLVPIVVFSVTWTDLYPHYLILIMPAAYIVFAVGTVDLWKALRMRESLRRVILGLAGMTLTAVLILQIMLWLSLVNFLERTNTPEGFGTPLRFLLPVRETILAGQPSQVLARLDGQFVGTDHDATVWNFLLYDIPSVRFLDENTTVYPSGPAVFLSRECELEPSPGTQQFSLRSIQEGCYQVTDDVPVNFTMAGYTIIPSESIFSNGVRLIGYQWLSDEQPCLELVWSIKMPTTEDYMFSVHFVNAAGQEVLNADGLSWRGIYWQPGDTVIRRFCLSSDQAVQQAEIVSLNVGMYTFDGTNFHNVDLLDPSGTPIGQTVSIRFNS